MDARSKRPGGRPKWCPAFLEAYELLGNSGRSCKCANVSTTTYNKYVKKHPAFEAEVNAAYERATQRMIDEARRRAVEGVAEPVYQGGVLVGTKQRYSDNLLMFLTKQRDPSFRDRVTLEASDELTEMSRAIQAALLETAKETGARGPLDKDQGGGDAPNKADQ